MQFEELSYASPEDPPIRRWLIHAIENASGRQRLAPDYAAWRRMAAQDPDRMMTRLLELRRVRLDITGGPWPPAAAPGLPLVVYANHPFGIGDGIALLAMAEAIGRPWRVFVDRHLLRIPELAPRALPIDFDETREATRTNLDSRRIARDFLRDGNTVVIFPAGAVATARNPFGKAEDLPWKNFVARLVQGTGAAVLPVFVEGQNSWVFHAATRIGETLRLSLLVSEFIRGFHDCTLRIRVGNVVPFEHLHNADNGQRLTEELRSRLDVLAAAMGE